MIVLLLSLDLAFLALHLVNAFLLDFPQPFLHLESDQSLSEYYQYLKFFSIACLLGLLAWRDKKINYFPLVLVFTYFLLDDSMQIHENAGIFFATYNLQPFYNPRPQYIGELIYAFFIGSILLIPSWVAYIKGNSFFKKFNNNIFLLILAFLFMAVGVDFAHMMFLDYPKLEFLIAIAEEFGELLVISIILYYVFAHFKSKEPIERI